MRSANPKADPTTSAVYTLARVRECLSAAIAIDRSTVGVSAELHICLEISVSSLHLRGTWNRRCDLCSWRANGSNKYEDTQDNPTNIDSDVILASVYMESARKESPQMQISRTIT